METTTTTKRNYVAMNAKYKGICATSGLPIAEGDKIAYYPESKTTHILIVAFPNGQFSQPRDKVKQFITGVFDQWINQENHSEQQDMYFSDDAIYSYNGAIQEAFELIDEIVSEEQENMPLHEMDIECAFE